MCQKEFQREHVKRDQWDVLFGHIWLHTYIHTYIHTYCPGSGSGGAPRGIEATCMYVCMYVHTRSTWISPISGNQLKPFMLALFLEGVLALFLEGGRN